jgi:hypothetical protein
MQATYHFNSAQELSADILEAIRLAFKSKPITIFIEEDDDNFGLSREQKAILDERLAENENTYSSSQESVNQLKAKYGL